MSECGNDYCCGYPSADEVKGKDVRAKRPHRVELVILVHSEDADKALGEVMEMMPFNLTYEYIRAGVAEGASDW